MVRGSTGLTMRNVGWLQRQSQFNALCSCKEPTSLMVSYPELVEGRTTHHMTANPITAEQLLAFHTNRRCALSPPIKALVLRSLYGRLREAAWNGWP